MRSLYQLLSQRSNPIDPQPTPLDQVHHQDVMMIRLRKSRRNAAELILVLIAAYCLFGLSHFIVYSLERPARLRIPAFGATSLGASAQPASGVVTTCTFSIGATISNPNRAFNATNVAVQSIFADRDGSSGQTRISTQLRFISAMQTTAIGYSETLGCGMKLVAEKILSVAWKRLPVQQFSIQDLRLSSQSNLLGNKPEVCFKNAGNAQTGLVTAVVLYLKNTLIVGGISAPIPYPKPMSTSCLRLKTDSRLTRLSNSTSVYLQL